MRNYGVFFKKEIIEGIRTYKFIILVAVFLIFGIMSPLFAKLTPDLLSSLGGEGISITVPDPTALDSWMQFFKNVSQMGLIVMVILFSGILAQEINRGTLINMLTKGLSRSAVVCAKYSVLILAWTVAYVLCVLATFGYTLYLFPDNNTENLIFSIIALWLFGILLLSALMLAASATKNNYVCLLAVALFAAVLMAISIVPATHNYNPLSLMTDSTALITGAMDADDLIPAIVITIVSSCACLITAILIFRKRRL